MTIASQVNDLIVPGTGSLAPVPLTFPFFSNADIQVARFSADGGITSLTEGVDYTLTGAGLPEVNGNAPGVLTPLTVTPVGQSLYVARIMAVEQPTDIRNQGRFYPDVHETVFDRITMLLQQINGVTERAIVVPAGDTAPTRTVPSVANRAGKFWQWGANGEPLAADIPNESTFWSRSPLSQNISTVQQMSDAQYLNLWEFASAVVTKPDPEQPSTWDWGPAIQAHQNACVSLGLAGFVPPGIYPMSQVVPPTGNFEYIGAGRNATFFRPFSASQTLFYKDQAPIGGVDNVTNARVNWRNFAVNDEAGLGGCRAFYGQRVLGWSFENILCRKLAINFEFNRSQNLNFLNIFEFKGGRWIFDAQPYRKFGATFDYCRNINITNVFDLLGYSDRGGEAWFWFRDAVNVLMTNVQSPALMGLSKGIEIRGASEGIELLNCIFVWPTTGVLVASDLVDTGTGLNVTLRPQYMSFISVHVDQPSGDAWDIDGEYWNIESSLGVNGIAQPGGTGRGLRIRPTSRWFNVSKTMFRDMSQDGILIESGAVDGTLRDCDVYNNASASGNQITATLTRPNGIRARDNRVVGNVVVTGGYWPGGNSSDVINRQSGSASLPNTAAETDLFTYTIPAGTLKAGGSGIGGQKIRLRANGTTAANTNSKTMRLYYGAASVASVVTAVSGAAWMLDAIIDLNSPGQAEYQGMGFLNGVAPTFARNIAGINEALAQIVKVTGTSPSAAGTGDIVCEHFSVELMPL